MEQQENKKCCTNCKYFEVRTGFCRKEPPQIIQQYIKNIGTVTNAVWPKVPFPALDWCSRFISANEKQLL